MQGSTGQSGNQNGQKQGGLSWTQSPSGSSVATNANNANAKPAQPNNAQASAKPANNLQNQQKNPGSMPNNTKNNQRQGSASRTAGIFIAGVIVGLIIGWGWFSLGDRGNGETADTGSMAGAQSGTIPSSSSTGSSVTGSAGANEAGTQTSGSASDNSAAVSGSNTLSVPSQAAGLQVSVASVSVSVPTWVVIFESANGKPGNALGARLFFPGDTSGAVDLLRGTVAGQTYLVGEYIDNGDHQFSKQKDTQVNTVAGTQMLVSFIAR